jgi:hypothetical protein
VKKKLRDKKGESMRFKENQMNQADGKNSTPKPDLRKSRFISKMMPSPIANR